MPRKSKAAYMISAVAEQYAIHPQTLRLYEREGLLKPSRSEGNTRLYTTEDLERLDAIRLSPVILQEHVPGVDIRVTARSARSRPGSSTRSRAVCAVNFAAFHCCAGAKRLPVVTLAVSTQEWC